MFLLLKIVNPNSTRPESKKLMKAKIDKQLPHVFVQLLSSKIFETYLPLAFHSEKQECLLAIDQHFGMGKDID